MFLADVDLAAYIRHHITDHPWPGFQVSLGGMKVTWMSDAIATMILTAVILLAIILPAAKRRLGAPKGMRNVMEVFVVFVRDMIARPTLHDKADRYLPFLLTVFVFIMGMNLIGLLPLPPLIALLGHWVPLKGIGIGGSPTGVLTVCAALTCLTLVTLLAAGLWRSASNFSHRHHWPMAVCLPLSPVLWTLSLSHPIPGLLGKFMFLPMTILEFAGVFAKIFALMIRLFANMLSGHCLLAVLLMFIFQMAAEGIGNSLGKFTGIGVVCVLSSVVMNVMEILVAALQAYIFTFLSAIYLGLYAEPVSHAEGQH